MHTVEARTKKLETHGRDGKPFTDRDGNEQVRVGVKIEGEWYNIYTSEAFAREIQKGTQLEGKIAENGKNYFLDRIAGTVSGSNGTSPTDRGSGSPSPSEDDRQLKIMRQSAQARAAQIFTGHRDATPDDVLPWIEFFYKDSLSVGEAPTTQADTIGAKGAVELGQAAHDAKMNDVALTLAIQAVGGDLDEAGLDQSLAALTPAQAEALKEKIAAKAGEPPF